MAIDVMASLQIAVHRLCNLHLVLKGKSLLIFRRLLRVTKETIGDWTKVN